MADLDALVPPYRIERSDVEAVYRIPAVHDRIRERFDWTLALDIRYQAIAWTLIWDQMEVRDSYARAYSSGDILRLASDWWPQGFDTVRTDQLRGLLDEMCGLGVLVRNAEGYYRLRSPNLVRLMGTETDIKNRLLELSEKQPPTPFDADNHHAPLDDAARLYSPLTYSQERSLNRPQWGVGLVFASEAGGLSTLPAAFRRLLPPDMSEEVGSCTEISSEITSGEELRRWLDNHLQTCSRSERLVVYYRPRGDAPESPQSLVRAALDFCHRHQSRKQPWMRVLFLFEPSVTWTWLTQPLHLREALENGADAVVFLRRWNHVGVRQRLAQHDKMHSDDVCQQVLRATGGWQLLLDILFDRCGTQDDVRDFALELEHALTEPSSQLAQQFYCALGLEGHHIARRVLEFVLQEGPVPVDWLAPEMIGGDSALTPEEVASAIEYLQRIGCLELRGDTVSIETIVERAMLQS